MPESVVETSTEVAEEIVSSVEEAPAEEVVEGGAFDKFLADQAALEAESTDQQADVSEVDPEPELSEEDTKEPLYEITIDGEPVQVTLEELQKGYNTNVASHKRFEEAARKIKEAQELETKTAEWKESLVRNPYNALKESGLSTEEIREHYEDVVYQWLQIDQMSAEEKAIHHEKVEFERTKKEHEKLRKELEEERTRKEQEQFNRNVAAKQEKILGDINSALESGGVPSTPAAIRAVALNMKTALESGYELPIEDAVDRYKDESSSSLKDMLQGLPEDALMQLIGKEKMDVLRKHDIDKLRNPSGLPKTQPKKSNPKREKIAASSFFDDLRKSTYK